MYNPTEIVSYNLQAIAMALTVETHRPQENADFTEKNEEFQGNRADYC